MRHSESAHHTIGKRPALLILALAALLLLAAVALAQGGYDLSWHAISGGGGHSAAGAFALAGGVLQPAGGMRGGNYQLAGGFWSSTGTAAVKTARAWLPVLLKSMTLR
jgi:hypothetical protein